jgi:catechol 2,3-dioxygenase-like lactoylglutathione lyase family enzyme
MVFGSFSRLHFAGLVAMQGNPNIHAIDDVRLEAPPHRERGLRVFYRDLIGLSELSEPPEPCQVVFHAHGRRVTIHVFADALASPMRRRLLIQVDSIEAMVRRMRRHGIHCRIWSGIGLGDRRLVALDPAGNRVELKEVRPL